MENEIKFEKFGKELFEKLTSIGLTSITKTDMDALILDLYLNTIGKGKKHSSYELMKLFKVTPSKLRSMELVRTMKYLPLDIKANRVAILELLKNNLTNIAKKIDTSNQKGVVTLVIEDTHLALVIEKWLTEKHGYVEYTLNSKVFRLNVIYFKELLKGLELNEQEYNDIVKSIPNNIIPDLMANPLLKGLIEFGFSAAFEFAKSYIKQ